MPKELNEEQQKQLDAISGLYDRIVAAGYDPDDFSKFAKEMTQQVAIPTIKKMKKNKKAGK